MMTDFRLLRADEIDCKIKQVSDWGVMILLYKDARCDMNILDETVGAMNWQRSHELINGNLFCRVGIRNDETGEWIWKQDVGVESMTEKEKGEASDSFKRACFNWGIGRELYTAPRMNVYKKDLTSLTQDRGKWICRDYFRVTDIQYTGRRIVYVAIENLRTHNILCFGEPAEEKQKREDTAAKRIGKVKADALLKRCADDGIPEGFLLGSCQVSDAADITEGRHAWIAANWAQFCKMAEGWKDGRDRSSK